MQRDEIQLDTASPPGFQRLVQVRPSATERVLEKAVILAMTQTENSNPWNTASDKDRDQRSARVASAV